MLVNDTDRSIFMYYNINPYARCASTLNTTRVCANNIIYLAIEASRMTFTHMKPNAIILVNRQEVFDGIAATSLVHFPIDAAILFTDRSMLSRETLAEILRLSPKGYRGVQVFLVGNISDNVASELNYVGLKTEQIRGKNHYDTACIIPRIRKEFKNILIVSGENFSEGIPAAYWSAHHGDPILYVKKDQIPNYTLETIRGMNDINIYILGSINTISKAVEQSLSKLPNVKHIDRINGATPYEIAVNFSKYKSPDGEFGWGRNYRDGHAFTFGALYNPMDIIGGATFAHMGKHTPLLLIKPNSVPSVVVDYLQAIKPKPPKDMPRPPFMHGFILGCLNQISYNTQIDIESLISIEH